MPLHDKISLAYGLLRFGGSGVLVLIGMLASIPWIGVLTSSVWLLWCGPVLRQLILPWLFPTTTCPGCRKILPLVGRWKCGSHYTDHCDRHILAFRCPQGHRLEGFDCPRCQATILVQLGDRQTVRHGSAVRLRILNQIPDAQGRALLVGREQGGRPVGIPDNRLSWHVAITGGTGRGKSTLLANLARQLAAHGTGFTVLDPGGDLARTVVQQIPPEREAGVLYLDVGDREKPFPLNVLFARDDTERAMLIDELLGVFRRLHGSSWGPLLAHQLRMALQAVMIAGGTLRDVYGLFVDDQTRARILARVHDPDLQAFWTEEFPTIPAFRRSAVTNKLTRVIFHPVLRPIICAPTCILNADRVIARRRIVIVNLAGGTPADDVTNLLGTFLVQKIFAAAFRQSALPSEQRVRHVLIVDEFQRFMHRAAGFDQILAEARKYKLSLVVANQFVEQLSPSVRAALFGNVGCLAAFRVGHRDARVLVPEFSGALPDDLLALELGQCLVRIGANWATVRTPPPPARPEDDPTPRIVAATHQQFPTQPPKETTTQPDPPEDESEFVQ